MLTTRLPAVTVVPSVVRIVLTDISTRVISIQNCQEKTGTAVLEVVKGELVVVFRVGSVFSVVKP